MIKARTIQTPSVAGKRGFSLISDEKFRQLYRSLLQCLILDKRLCGVAGYEFWPGCEPAAAAVAACLRRGDTIIPTPRGVLAHYLHTGSVAPTDRPIATAAQYDSVNQSALRHNVENRGGVAVLFAQTAAPATMREVFASAAKQSLPVLYVLEGGTPRTEICSDIPVIRVDSSDTVALFRVAHESIARARDSIGPTIIECAAWPADPEPPDPLFKFEEYLAGKKLFRPHWKRSLERKYASGLAEAFDLANSPSNKPVSVHVPFQNSLRAPAKEML
jgi:TPP-dependent pyruvate/acetoin dehydrogenase alpha subunit